MSPRTVVTLLLAGCAVTSFAGCRNLFQPCGPALVVTPNFDSTSVGGTVTFRAAEGGGCGLSTRGTVAQGAAWRVHDTTVARISAVSSDDVVTVRGVRAGETAIAASWQGLIGVAYFQVN